MPQRLLAAGPSSPAGTPAFVMRVSGDLQQLLARNSLRLKLIVKDGCMSLNANGQVYPLDTSTEHGATEVFMHLSQSSLKSIGTVKTRLQINTPISSPASTSSASSITDRERTKPASSTASTSHTKKPSPPPLTIAEPRSQSRNRAGPGKTLVASGTKVANILKRVIHLLALGPITRDEICRRTRLSAQEVDMAVTNCAMLDDPSMADALISEYPNMTMRTAATPDTELLVLGIAHYKDLKLGEWKYNDRDLELIMKNAQKAFFHLEYPDSHPAWDMLKRCAKLLQSKSQSQSPKSPSEKPLNSVTKSQAQTPKTPEEPYEVKKEKKSQLRTPKSPDDLKRARVDEPKSSSKSTETSLKRTQGTHTEPTSKSKQSTNTKSEFSPEKLPRGPARDHSNRKDQPANHSHAPQSAQSPLIPLKVDHKHHIPPAPPSNASTPTSVAASFTPDTEASKKRKRDENSIGQRAEYLMDLALRFQTKYKEYETLYRELREKKQKDRGQVQKLVDLHKNLESWKKQLWSTVTTE